MYLTGRLYLTQLQAKGHSLLGIHHNQLEQVDLEIGVVPHLDTVVDHHLDTVADEVDLEVVVDIALAEVIIVNKLK